MATDDFPGAVTKSINTWKDISLIWQMEKETQQKDYTQNSCAVVSPVSYLAHKTD